MCNTLEELEENGQLAKPAPVQVLDAIKQVAAPLTEEEADLEIEADLVIALSMLESVKTDVFLFLKANADIRKAIPMQDWVTLTAIEKAIGEFVRECDAKAFAAAQAATKLPVIPFIDPCSC